MYKANVDFKLKDGNLLPFNNDFDDFYTSVNCGVEQKMEAFIAPVFEDLKSKNCKIFTVLELGFGLGINFFLFVNECLKYQDKQFYYIGYEKYYHDIEFLKKSWDIFGVKSPAMETFVKLYPMQRHGIYRIRFLNITLDLVYGEECLYDYHFLADYVFVDGFKSTTNTLFYEDDFLKTLKCFLKFDTKLFSYASNSMFKKSLALNGFDVTCVNSLYKRENIQATYKQEQENSFSEGYLLRNKDKKLNKKTIAIIGTGVSGAVLSYLLSSFDDEVLVFEKESDINSGASTNKIGILSALILKKSSHMQKYYESIYLNATRFYLNELNISLNGCYEYAFDDEKKKRFDDQKDNILYEITDKEAFIKNGGELEPIRLVPAIFDKSNAKIYTNHKLTKYEKVEDKVKLYFDNGKDFIVDIVVFCSGAGSKILFKEDIKMSINQGQVTHVEEFLDTKPYSSKSYITPSKNGMQVIGATYERIEEDVIFENNVAKNNSFNIDNLISSYPYKIDASKIKIIGYKIGNRCYSSDRFPIIGGFFSKKEYANMYKGLFFTKHKKHNLLPKTNVYLNTAHGSRGLASAIMGANVIISSIYGVPSSYLSSVEKDVNPCRFVCRELKKS